MDFFRIFFLGIVSILKGIINIFKYFFIGLYNVIIFIPKYFIIGIMVIFGKKKKEKRSSENKKLSFAILCLSLSVYLVCVFLISRWYVQGLKIEYLSNDIINSTEIIEKEETPSDDGVDVIPPSDEDNIDDGTEEEPDNSTSNNPSVYYPNDYWDYMNVPFMNVNFDELLNKNSDTVGWIKIDGTKVNYPVVQSADNDYYLSHAFNKSNNIGGWIFADYRVDFEEFGRNTIIYGHNMNNKTMFGSVPDMLKSSYLNNNDNYIKISTPTSNTVWKVFSIYTIEPEVYYLKTNFKTEPYENFLNTIKGRSIHNFGLEVTTDDKVLTLSTCDNTGTKRVVVHAKMISIEYK